MGYVYEGSTAESNGVSRGWQILTINGVQPSPEIDIDTLLGDDEVGVENTFKFMTRDGGTTTMTLAKEIVEINSVLYSDLLDVGGKKTGYLVYQHFLHAFHLLFQLFQSCFYILVFPT